jgi:CP family cyanate transporter-like MFS transporter
MTTVTGATRRAKHRRTRHSTNTVVLDSFARPTGADFSGTIPPPGRHRRIPGSGVPEGRQLLTVLAIVTLAMNLRSGVTSLGPVLGEISGYWQLSGAVQGMLTALPAVCFGAIGAAAPVLARRWGSERLVVVALATSSVGLVARAAATSVPGFLVASVLALSGAAIGNVLLPPLVARYFPDRVGGVTALYTTALALGMTGGAALTVPAEQALGGGWRYGLGVWALLAAVALPPWLMLAAERRTAAARSTPAPSVPAPRGGAGRGGERRGAPVPPLYRSASVRALTMFFGCQALNAYVVLGWLPTVLADAGLDHRAASLPVAAIGALSVPLSLLLPGLAVRRTARCWLVAGTSAAYAGGYLGLLCAPAAAPWLWAVLFGLGNGAFPLAATMIGLAARRAELATSLSALVQGGGYLVAAAGPALVGVLHQASGGWRVPLLALLAPVAGQLYGGLRAARAEAEPAPRGAGSAPQPAQQRSDPVAHQLTHHQRRVGAFHTGDGQDLPRYPVQVVGVPGHHVHQQVGLPGHALHLEHLGDVGQRIAHLVQPALGDPGGHVRGQRVTERGRIHPALEGVQRAPLVQSGQPGLHGVAGQPEPLGQGHGGGPGLIGQREQQPRVQGVGAVGAGHGAHSRSGIDR